MSRLNLCGSLKTHIWTNCEPISRDIPRKDGNVTFTTVPSRPLSDILSGRYCRFSMFKCLILKIPTYRLFCGRSSQKVTFIEKPQLKKSVVNIFNIDVLCTIHTWSNKARSIVVNRQGNLWKEGHLNLCLQSIKFFLKHFLPLKPISSLKMYYPLMSTLHFRHYCFFGFSF